MNSDKKRQANFDAMSMSQVSGRTNPLSNKPFDDNPAQNALALLMGTGEQPGSPGRENVLSPEKGGIDFSREETDMRSLGDEQPIPQSAANHRENREDSPDKDKKKKKKKDKDKKNKKDKRDKKVRSNFVAGDAFDDGPNNRLGPDV